MLYKYHAFEIYNDLAKYKYNAHAKGFGNYMALGFGTVSYTHLTLPTNREV